MKRGGLNGPMIYTDCLVFLFFYVVCSKNSPGLSCRNFSFVFWPTDQDELADLLTVTEP